MKKKKDLYFIIIFILIFSFSFIYLFQSSYAKYKKQIKGEVEANIASWNIKVNNETINNKSELENTITPTIDQNEYVKEGVIAPGTTGYFDIIFDTSEVDVDFIYEIVPTVANLTDLKIISYELNSNNTKIPFVDKISQELKKNTKETTIRFYIQWIDDNTETMDNQQDTSYAAENETTKINLTIKFTQKKAN